MTKKLIIFLFLVLLTGNVFARNKGDNMGNHKASRNIDVNNFDLVGSSQAFIENRIIVGSAAYSGSDILYIGNKVGAKMVIQSTGNIGFVTNNPSVEVDLAKDENGVVQMRVVNLSGGTDAAAILAVNNSDGVSLRMRQFGGGATGGNVFGQTRSNLSIFRTIADLDTKALAIGNFRDIPLIFGVNDTEDMRIDVGGNVGIGTDSPSETLEVNGNIKYQPAYAEIALHYPNGGSGYAVGTNYSGIASTDWIHESTSSFTMNNTSTMTYVGTVTHKFLVNAGFTIEGLTGAFNIHITLFKNEVELENAEQDIEEGAANADGNCAINKIVELSTNDTIALQAKCDIGETIDFEHVTFTVTQID